MTNAKCQRYCKAYRIPTFFLNICIDTSELANTHPCKLRMYLGQEHPKPFISQLIKFFSFIIFFSHLFVNFKSHSLQDFSSSLQHSAGDSKTQNIHPNFLISYHALLCIQCDKQHFTVAL